MYKFSQDHLELFFSSMRAAGGRNDNPTAAQFIAAFKWLLMRSSIAVGSNGNCIKQDDTSILNIMQDVVKVGEKDIAISEMALIRKYDLDERTFRQTESDDFEPFSLSSSSLSESNKIRGLQLRHCQT